MKPKKTPKSSPRTRSKAAGSSGSKSPSRLRKKADFALRRGGPEKKPGEYTGVFEDFFSGPTKHQGESGLFPEPASSSAESFAGLGEIALSLAVGHAQKPSLTPEMQELLRSFQANLVSLISHELKTPLMGILNALTWIESEKPDCEEPVAMARRNALALERNLASLLDLAEIELGSLHVKPREVLLPALARSRAEAQAEKARALGIEIRVPRGGEAEPVLADPIQMGKAIDAVFRLIFVKAQPASSVELRISSRAVEFSFYLQPELRAEWERAWQEALVAEKAGGVQISRLYLSGVLQGESEFLTRRESGIGGEILVVQEILRLHGGRCYREAGSHAVGTDVGAESCRETVVLELPELDAARTLDLAVGARTRQAAVDLGSFIVACLSVPAGVGAADFRLMVKRSLFRPSDNAYVSPDGKKVYVVLDDCREEDARKVVDRVGLALGIPLQAGFAACPEDSTAAATLIELAERRMQ